jgi:hypothetical protein
MKYLSASLFVLILLTSCEKKLEFEKETYVKKTSLPCTDQCPQITLTVPIAKNGIVADSINNKILSTLKGIISFGEKPFPAKNYTELLDSFIDAYEQLQQDSPDDVFGWEGDIEGAVTYQTDNILNIQIKHYTFTGGAHGYSGLRSLLFDPKTGRSISVQQLFKNPSEFKAFAEKRFRKKFEIPEKSPINYKGLMFENEEFQLPQNIFFTEKGLLLYYNAYEIASYAEGAQELLLPYSDVDSYLKTK